MPDWGPVFRSKPQPGVAKIGPAGKIGAQSGNNCLLRVTVEEEEVEEEEEVGGGGGGGGLEGGWR